MPLILLIILPFVGSLLAAVLPANARNTESTLAGIISLVCTVQAALLFPEIANGQVLRQEIAWLPSLGLDFVVRMDGFAWMFSMLVLGIKLSNPKSFCHSIPPHRQVLDTSGPKLRSAA